MLTTVNRDAAQGHDAQRGEVLERIHQEYGKPEEKQREPIKKLGKDEFFKIMVTQIQHQDPLKPYQNEQMAAQMAQFSALEQMVNVNQNIDKLAQAQQPLQQLTSASLIGKYVTADSSRLLHTEGKYSDIIFDLPNDAMKVRATIINEKGENIQQIEKEGLKKGSNRFEWDGRRANKMPCPSGNYMVQIFAEDENGKPIQVSTQKTAIVHGVGFEGKDTVLLTGDVRNPQKMLLRDVSRIVDKPAQGAGNGGGQESIGAAPTAAGFPMNGEGSSPEAADAQAAETPALGGDRIVPGIIPGQASAYTPFDVGVFNKANEKSEPVPQGLDASEIRKLLDERKDLSEANPVATAMREGKKLEDQKPTGQESAARQSLQSSNDGSTAGQWGE